MRIHRSNYFIIWKVLIVTFWINASCKPCKWGISFVLASTAAAICIAYIQSSKSPKIELLITYACEIYCDRTFLFSKTVIHEGRKHTTHRRKNLHFNIDQMTEEPDEINYNQHVIRKGLPTVGNVSFEDWLMLTWSLGWTPLLPIGMPIISPARFAMTCTIIYKKSNNNLIY